MGKYKELAMYMDELAKETEGEDYLEMPTLKEIAQNRISQRLEKIKKKEKSEAND